MSNLTSSATHRQIIQPYPCCDVFSTVVNSCTTCAYNWHNLAEKERWKSIIIMNGLGVSKKASSKKKSLGDWGMCSCSTCRSPLWQWKPSIINFWYNPLTYNDTAFEVPIQQCPIAQWLHCWPISQTTMVRFLQGKLFFVFFFFFLTFVSCNKNFVDSI